MNAYLENLEEKLRERGLELPPVPQPAGCYVPYRIHREMLILSGMLPVRNGIVTHVGQVGSEQTVETAYEAARICTLNALALLRPALGAAYDLETILFVSGYVNAVSGFAESPEVINGASELLVDLFGEAGKHARAAVAVAGLPRNATVELQMNIALRPRV
jgi:enamine deaminase RidA (YjgF/YER057c/UK114 family)